MGFLALGYFGDEMMRGGSLYFHEGLEFWFSGGAVIFSHSESP
jgi:hypothetical protein